MRMRLQPKAETQRGWGRTGLGNTICKGEGWEVGMES